MALYSELLVLVAGLKFSFPFCKISSINGKKVWFVYSRRFLGLSRATARLDGPLDCGLRHTEAFFELRVVVLQG